MHLLTLRPWPLIFQPRNHIISIGYSKVIPYSLFSIFPIYSGIIHFLVRPMLQTNRQTDICNSFKMLQFEDRMPSHSLVVVNTSPEFLAVGELDRRTTLSLTELQATLRLTFDVLDFWPFVLNIAESYTELKIFIHHTLVALYTFI